MKFRVVVGACVTFAVLAGALPAAAAPRPKQPDKTAPTVPTNLRITAATEDSMSVAWTASTDNSGAIHHYVTCYSGWLIPSPGYCIWGSPVPPAKTVTGLVPGREFTFRVKAVDAAGNESALSSPVTGSTAPDVTAPTAPANARVTATTPSSVSLAWDRSTDGWSFTYQVLMDGEVIASTWDLAFRARHLTPGTTHVFAIRARDSSGNLSAASNAVTVALEASSDRTPPSTPTGLTATQPPDDFCGSNVLQWNTATDDVDPPSAIEYEVYQNGALRSVTAPGLAWAFLYTFAGTNTWTVIAVDRAGNSSGVSHPATLTVQQDSGLC